MFVMSDHPTQGRQTRVANTTTKATYLDQPEGSSVGQGLYQSEVQSKYVPFDFTHKADLN